MSTASVGRETHKPWSKSRAGRVESIQVLRGIAAIGVVFTHSITRISRTVPNGTAHSVLADNAGQLTVGDAGVDLFFVVSGFIMLYVHQDDFAQSGASLKFIVKRLVRIVPLYWVLTTVAVAFMKFAPKLFTTHSTQIDIAWIVGSYLFMPIGPAGGQASPIVGVGWTLNYEMFFYAIFAVALMMPRRRALWSITIGLGASVAVGAVLKSPNPWIGFVTNWLLLDFLMGVAIAWRVLSEPKISENARRILLFGGAGCLAMTIAWPPPEDGPLRFLLWGIPAAFIVYSLGSANVPAAGHLRTIGSILGDASYSIYLFQFFLIPAFAQVMLMLGAEVIPFDLNVLILTALVTASGVLCWIAVERPLGHALRRILRWRGSMA